MTISQRRHARYNIPDEAFASQELKLKGWMGAIGGWATCKIKDVSCAGMLMLTSKKLTIGDLVRVRLTTADSSVLEFQCAVVNASTEHSSGQIKVGLSIESPAEGTDEAIFLSDLAVNYKESL